MAIATNKKASNAIDAKKNKNCKTTTCQLQNKKSKLQNNNMSIAKQTRKSNCKSTTCQLQKQNKKNTYQNQNASDTFTNRPNALQCHVKKHIMQKRIG